MPRKKKEVEESEVKNDISEKSDAKQDETTLLQMAATLLKVDRAIMDIQTTMIKGFLDRLSKYEDVSKDRELISRLSILDRKEDTDASVATESDG